MRNNKISTECPLIGKGQREDDLALSLHPEARSLYYKANERYRMDSKRYFERICINSGKRSVLDQVELYRKFKLHAEFGGPPANPANNPGYSHHEYGIAIDIFRIDDESRLKAALENEGWKQKTSKNESHHYSANEIPSLDIINRKRTEILGKHIGLKNTILDHIRKEFQIEELKEQSALEKGLERRLRRKLILVERKVDRESIRVNRLADSEEDLHLEMNEIEESNIVLRMRYKNYRYTLCPNGWEYERCDHFDLKRRYDLDKSEMKREINDNEREVKKLRQEHTRLESKIKALETRISKMELEIELLHERLKEQSEIALQARLSLRNAKRDIRNVWSEITKEASIIQEEIDNFIYG